MVGNPCTDWPHWKEYLMARLPNLGRIDGTDISKSLKLDALQKFDMMATDLVFASRKRIEKKAFEDTQPKNPNAYSKEFRRECYLE
jgi:protein TilB